MDCTTDTASPPRRTRTRARRPRGDRRGSRTCHTKHGESALQESTKGPPHGASIVESRNEHYAGLDVPDSRHKLRGAGHDFCHKPRLLEAAEEARGLCPECPFN